MTDVTPDSIFQVASGFMASKHLFVANEVGLFQHLAEGQCTLEDLSARTGIPQRRICILADAMVALGFVDRYGDSYRNGPVAATFLSGLTPADLRPLLRFWNQISYPAWTQQETSIRTGEGSFGHRSEELDKIFSEGVEAITAGTAEALATTYNFGQHHRILAEKILGRSVVFVLAFADLDDRVLRERFDLAGVQPHRAGPLHRLQHAVENAGDNENFFFGDAQQIVVVGPAANNASGGVVEIGRFIDDNGWIARTGDDCPLA